MTKRILFCYFIFLSALAKNSDADVISRAPSWPSLKQFQLLLTDPLPHSELLVNNKDLNAIFSKIDKLRIELSKLEINPYFVSSTNFRNSSIFVQTALLSHLEIFRMQILLSLHFVSVYVITKKSPKSLQSVQSFMQQLQDVQTYMKADEVIKHVVPWMPSLASYNSILSTNYMKSISTEWIAANRIIRATVRDSKKRDFDSSITNVFNSTFGFLFDTAEIAKVFVTFSKMENFNTYSWKLYTDFDSIAELLLEDMRSISMINNTYFYNAFCNNLDELLIFSKNFIAQEVTFKNELNSLYKTLQWTVSVSLNTLKSSIISTEKSKSTAILGYFNVFTRSVTAAFRRLKFPDNVIFKNFYLTYLAIFERTGREADSKTMEAFIEFSELGSNLTRIMSDVVESISNCNAEVNRKSCTKNVSALLKDAISKIYTMNSKTTPKLYAALRESDSSLNKALKMISIDGSDKAKSF